MRAALILLLLIPCAGFAGEISFGASFPDPQLRGMTCQVLTRDHAEAMRLRSAIYQKEIEIINFVRSCSTNSPNWREDAQHFNHLRAQNYALMKELRAIVARGR